MHWFSFVVGALVGWLVEWLIDIFYWRRRWQKCQEDEARLREELANAKNETARLRAVGPETSQLRSELTAARARIAELDVQLPGLRGELDVAHARIAELDAQLPDLRGELDVANARSADLDAQLPVLKSELDAAYTRIAELNARLSAPHIEAPSFEAPSFEARAVAAPDLEAPEVTYPSERTGQLELPDVDLGVAGLGASVRSLLPDDLKLIEGIGPAIARLLDEQGIRTFAELAGTPLVTLQRILADAGPRFRVADPGSWAQQALLAASGDWDGLKALQDQLKGGR